jgi:NADH:ubiquinone oxidoreductase subunit 6 (subunit J)
VLVVIIFAIMLTNKQSGEPLRTGHSHLFSGILAGSLLFVLLIILISDSGSKQASTANSSIGSLQNIGINLITKFALPFEISGILLLIALIGAAVLASHMKSKDNVPD